MTQIQTIPFWHSYCNSDYFFFFFFGIFRNNDTGILNYFFAKVCVRVRVYVYVCVFVCVKYKHHSAWFLYFSSVITLYLFTHFLIPLKLIWLQFGLIKYHLTTLNIYITTQTQREREREKKRERERETHTHTHTHIYIYIYMCVCACVCICLPIWACACVRACVHTHV